MMLLCNCALTSPSQYFLHPQSHLYETCFDTFFFSFKCSPAAVTLFGRTAAHLQMAKLCESVPKPAATPPSSARAPLFTHCYAAPLFIYIYISDDHFAPFHRKSSRNNGVCVCVKKWNSAIAIWCSREERTQKRGRASIICAERRSVCSHWEPPLETEAVSLVLLWCIFADGVGLGLSWAWKASLSRSCQRSRRTRTRAWGKGIRMEPSPNSNLGPFPPWGGRPPVSCLLSPLPGISPRGAGTEEHLIDNQCFFFTCLLSPLLLNSPWNCEWTATRLGRL